MDPYQRNRSSIGFKDQAICITPDSYGIFSEVDYSFFGTIGIKSLNFRCLINLNIPNQILILQIPNLKLLRSMHNHQMRRIRNLQNPITKNSRIRSNSKQILRRLNPMERYRFFVTVGDTCVPVVILQIFYYEFLADVYHAVVVFGC